MACLKPAGRRPDPRAVFRERSNTIDPRVPGHEVVGRVTKIGAGFTTHAVGDIVGVGGMTNSCRRRQPCKPGERGTSANQRQACTLAEAVRLHLTSTKSQLNQRLRCASKARVWHTWLAHATEADAPIRRRLWDPVGGRQPSPCHQLVCEGGDLSRTVARRGATTCRAIGTNHETQTLPSRP
jgi:Alcohol dehydrogenase GroES-like domain